MSLSVFGQRNKWYVGALCRDALPAPVSERLRAKLTEALKAARRFRTPALCVFSAGLLAAGVLAFAGRGGEEVCLTLGNVSVAFQTPAKSAVSCGAPKQGQKNVTYTRRDLLLGTLLLVGPEHPLPSDFPGANARGVRQMVGSYLNAQEGVALREEVVYALCDMRVSRLMNDALLNRGAVSSATQNSLRREAFSRYLAVGTVENALEQMNKNVPRAGESEHQTGLCVDVELLGDLSYASTDPLKRTETGRWISENMAAYGFVRRYMTQGEDGGCEGIHLRYVGKVHAQAMQAGGWTLEEYLAALRANGCLTVRGEGYTACVLAFEGDAGGSVSAMADAVVTVSADNAGWTIVTAVTNTP